jgi:uncharacterized peroxidase-related enzyme
MSHARDFGQESGNTDVAEQLVFDYRKATLSGTDRALCDYAVKLTLAPGEMTERDAARLREFGFSDEAITIAAQVIGYFNYINRIADGLGVDPEDWMTLSKDDWDRRRGRDYTIPSRDEPVPKR